MLQRQPGSWGQAGLTRAWGRAAVPKPCRPAVIASQHYTGVRRNLSACELTTQQRKSQTLKNNKVFFFFCLLLIARFWLQPGLDGKYPREGEKALSSLQTVQGQA